MLDGFIVSELKYMSNHIDHVDLAIIASMLNSRECILRLLWHKADNFMVPGGYDENNIPVS